MIIQEAMRITRRNADSRGISNTEYLVVLALVAIAGMSMTGLFGSQVKGSIQRAVAALAGTALDDSSAALAAKAAVEAGGTPTLAGFEPARTDGVNEGGSDGASDAGPAAGGSGSTPPPLAAPPANAVRTPSATTDELGSPLPAGVERNLPDDPHLADLKIKDQLPAIRDAFRTGVGDNNATLRINSGVRDSGQHKDGDAIDINISGLSDPQVQGVIDALRKIPGGEKLVIGSTLPTAGITAVGADFGEGTYADGTAYTHRNHIHVKFPN